MMTTHEGHLSVEIAHPSGHDGYRPIAVQRATADLLERAEVIRKAGVQGRTQQYESTDKLHPNDFHTAIREAEALVKSSREDQIRRMLLNALDARP